MPDWMGARLADLWEPEEDELLLEARQAGFDWEQCSEHLALNGRHRTAKGCASRVKRLLRKGLKPARGHTTKPAAAKSTRSAPGTWQQKVMICRLWPGPRADHWKETRFVDGEAHLADLSDAECARIAKGIGVHEDEVGSRREGDIVMMDWEKTFYIECYGRPGYAFEASGGVGKKRDMLMPVDIAQWLRRSRSAVTNHVSNLRGKGSEVARVSAAGRKPKRRRPAIEAERQATVSEVQCTHDIADAGITHLQKRLEKLIRETSALAEEVRAERDRPWWKKLLGLR